MWKYITIVAVAILAFLITSYPAGSVPMDDDTPQYEVDSEFKHPPIPKPRPARPSIVSEPVSADQREFICLAKNIYLSLIHI